MTRSERAKQFLAFDAMKGLSEALREKEEKHLRVEKRELTEEEIERISGQLKKLKLGDSVEAHYYFDFHEKTITGKLTKIDCAFKCLAVNNENILFDDIYKIKKLN